MLAVSKHRGWLDKEFVEYEIAAIVSAAITRDAILSTSDRFTISVIRPRVPGERGWRSCCRLAGVAQTLPYRRVYIRGSFHARARGSKKPTINTNKLQRSLLCSGSSVFRLRSHLWERECTALEMRRGTVIFVKPSSAASTFAGMCYNGRAVEKRRKRVRDCPIIR